MRVKGRRPSAVKSNRRASGAGLGTPASDANSHHRVAGASLENNAGYPTRVLTARGTDRRLSGTGSYRRASGATCGSLVSPMLVQIAGFPARGTNHRVSGVGASRRVSGASCGSPGFCGVSPRDFRREFKIAGFPTRVLIAWRPVRVRGHRISDAGSNRRVSGASYMAGRSAAGSTCRASGAG